MGGGREREMGEGEREGGGGGGRERERERERVCRVADRHLSRRADQPRHRPSVPSLVTYCVAELGTADLLY